MLSVGRNCVLQLSQVLTSYWPLPSKWRFARTFQDYRSSKAVSTFRFNFLRSLRADSAEELSKPLAQTPLLPHSTAFQCQNIQTPTRGARHLAPNYLYCSNLGLESSGPSGLRPGSNAWTALRLTPQPADPPFPAGPPNPVKVRSSLTCLCYSNRSYLQDQPCCRLRQASIACRLLRLG